MIGIGKISPPFAHLLPMFALMAATPALADEDCRQWDVPPRLVVRQGDGQHVAFDLKQDGASFYGWASYQTTEKRVVGNVSGSITKDVFYARVLWTYSGVSAIGRYQGLIRPRTEVPVGQPTYGFVHEGTTYDEYKRGADLTYWSADHFSCHVDAPPPPPRVEREANFAEEKKDNAALAALAAARNTIRAQGRVRVEGAPTTTKLTICESARAAKARNSPATAGLEKQCLASGGSLAEPIPSAQLAELAVRGGPIAAADPLSAALRAQQTEAGQLGFDIGMAAAENQTAPGPGKQHIHDSLGKDEQPGYAAAVSFSLERNRNLDLAARGAAIAAQDASVAHARSANADVFFQLGFDIATGIFGDPAQGALGNTSTGPGSLKIRDALSPAGQRGFNAAVALHLARDYAH